MKKLIKRKLSYQNGLYRNFFLWEIRSERGPVYEIIEEFKGHSISRAMLKGIYNDRLKALADFRKITATETTTRRAPVQRLVFS